MIVGSLHDSIQTPPHQEYHENEDFETYLDLQDWSKHLENFKERKTPSYQNKFGWEIWLFLNWVLRIQNCATPRLLKIPLWLSQHFHRLKSLWDMSFLSSESSSNFSAAMKLNLLEVIFWGVLYHITHIVQWKNNLKMKSTKAISSFV